MSEAEKPEAATNESGAVPAVETTRATRAVATDKSPILTRIEQIVHDFCVETGDQPGAALEHDPALHRLLVEKVAGDIRVERILVKLDRNAKWLKAQLEKARSVN